MSTIDKAAGRFVTVATNTTRENARFCAKLTAETPCYLRFEDVNSGKVLTRSKATAQVVANGRTL